MEYRKYDIVQADLGEGTGSEQAGIRPVVIVQNNVGNTYSCTTLVMPLTTRRRKKCLPTHTVIRQSVDTGLMIDSILLGEQLRAIDNKRILKKIGRITNEQERREIRRVYSVNFGED